jgi:hypothetical protein
MRLIPCPLETAALRKLYLEDHLTDAAIASQFGAGVSSKQVRRWRIRAGIPTINRTERHEVPPIEGSLVSLLVGSVLGDGRLDRLKNTTRFIENHAADQREYLEWKVGLWGPWVKSGVKPVVWVHPEGSFPGFRFETVAHAELNPWHNVFYGSSTRKRLDRAVVPLVDEFALAIWFMDDGSAGWWPRITFGMDVVSQGVAMGIFDRFGLHPRWEIHKGNTGDFIFEGEDQAHRFIALVAPHMPECMRRKLTFGFQGPHYQVRQVLTEDALRKMASEGVPIKRMARELGQSETTVRRYLQTLNIAHPRRIGRPPRSA